MKKIIMLLILFSLTVHAIDSIEITEPYSKTVKDEDTINLGTIGPGQTMYVEFNPRVQGIGWWDQAIIENEPDGWLGVDSKLNDEILKARITSSAYANEGEYTFQIIIVDENNANNLGNITVNCKLNIKHDIMDMQVTPKEKVVGAGQPAVFNIVIVNKGNTEDEFVIRSEGVKEWSFKKQIYIPAKSQKEIEYEVVVPEEENYDITIISESYGSPDIIYERENVKIEVKPDLISDMKSTNNGLLLFPIIESPVHSILGIISNLFE